jgi:hypothetical protein
MREISRRLGYKNGAYLSQLIGKNPIEELSERTARTMELKLGLTPGSLDSTPEQFSAQPVHANLSEVISRMIEALGPDTLSSMSSERFGQLCTIVFTQIRQGHMVTDDFVQQLVKLVAVR